MSSPPTLNLTSTPTPSIAVPLPSINHGDSMSLSSLKINETPPSPSSTSEGGGEKREREDSPTRSQGQGQGHGPTTSSMSIPSIEIQGSTPPKNGQSNDNAPIQPKLKAILPSLTSCVHTSCYCEENIWLLCDRIRSEYSTELDHCTVAFISNPRRMVPLWRQKSGKTEEKLAIWDYHVILLYNPDDRCVVYDLDSDLPFPTHFHKYVTETFRTESILQPEYHRFFRCINAADFLRIFSSDRSHMVAKEDGTFVKPPPSYPPIYKNGVNNLEEFLDMTPAGTGTEKTEFGEVLPLMDMVRRFYKAKRS